MFFIGLDLGQKRDHTAIAVVERLDFRLDIQSFGLGYLAVRHVERVALATPYQVVAERVESIAGQLAGMGYCSLAVDATGVGAPVVDMLRAKRMACDMTPVTITGGAKASESGWGWSVPKKDLIAGVQLLLEKDQLRIARDMVETGALLRELIHMKLDGTNEGEHDDLAIALALACWQAMRVKPRGYQGRLSGI